jgi:hypothetical protein
MIEYEALINNGVMGVVLAWFMFRMEKVINNNTTSLNEMQEVITKCKR